MHHEYIDKYAHGRSPMHHFNAQAKVVVAIGYMIGLVLAGRGTLAGLAPLAVGPVAWLIVGGVPLGFAMRRVLVLSPLILTLALAQPIFLRQRVELSLGPWTAQMSLGWLTAGNLAMRFALGVLALTALVCTTPFASLLQAGRRLGVPPALVMTLAFLYRYLFVLMDEAMRIRRARDFRGAALAPAGRRLAAVGGIVASMFIRTWQRAERIHLAMCARGYDGTPRTLDRPHWHWQDVVFLLAGLAYAVAATTFAYFTR